MGNQDEALSGSQEPIELLLMISVIGERGCGSRAEQLSERATSH